MADPVATAAPAYTVPPDIASALRSKDKAAFFKATRAAVEQEMQAHGQSLPEGASDQDVARAWTRKHQDVLRNPKSIEPLATPAGSSFTKVASDLAHSAAKNLGYTAEGFQNLQRAVPPSAPTDSALKKFGKGAARGLATGVEQVSSPENLALLGGMTAVPAAISAIPGVGEVAAPVIATLAGVKFTYDTALNLVKSLPEARKAFVAKDWDKLGNIIGQDAMGALILRGVGKGTTKAGGRANEVVGRKLQERSNRSQFGSPQAPSAGPQPRASREAPKTASEVQLSRDPLGREIGKLKDSEITQTVKDRLSDQQLYLKQVGDAAKRLRQLNDMRRDSEGKVYDLQTSGDPTSEGQKAQLDTEQKRLTQIRELIGSTENPGAALKALQEAQNNLNGSNDSLAKVAREATKRGLKVSDIKKDLTEPPDSRPGAVPPGGSPGGTQPVGPKTPPPPAPSQAFQRNDTVTRNGKIGKVVSNPRVAGQEKTYVVRFEGDAKSTIVNENELKKATPPTPPPPAARNDPAPPPEKPPSPPPEGGGSPAPAPTAPPPPPPPGGGAAATAPTSLLDQVINQTAAAAPKPNAAPPAPPAGETPAVSAPPPVSPPPPPPPAAATPGVVPPAAAPAPVAPPVTPETAPPVAAAPPPAPPDAAAASRKTALEAEMARLREENEKLKKGPGAPSATPPGATSQNAPANTVAPRQEPPPVKPSGAGQVAPAKSDKSYSKGDQVVLDTGAVGKVKDILNLKGKTFYKIDIGQGGKANFQIVDGKAVEPYVAPEKPVAAPKAESAPPESRKAEPATKAEPAPKAAEPPPAADAEPEDESDLVEKEAQKPSRVQMDNVAKAVVSAKKAGVKRAQLLVLNAKGNVISSQEFNPSEITAKSMEPLAQLLGQPGVARVGVAYPERPDIRRVEWKIGELTQAEKKATEPKPEKAAPPVARSAAKPAAPRQGPPEDSDPEADAEYERRMKAFREWNQKKAAEQPEKRM